MTRRNEFPAVVVGVLLSLVAMILAPSANAAARWIDSTRQGDIAYFLYDVPATIERYDLATEQALPSIALSGTPTAFAVDGDGIYVAFGRRVARLQLDGTGETHLRNAPVDITGLVVIDGYLLISYNDIFVSIDKLTGAFIDEADYFYRLTGLSVAPTVRRVFGRSVGISPADILYVDVNADGTLGVQDDSPYHGDFPGATGTWVLPGDAMVVDSAGIVYSTNLDYLASLAGAFDSIGFHGAAPIVLRGSTLHGYGAGFLKEGEYELSAPAGDIYVRDGVVYAFSDDGGGLAVETVAAALIVPTDPSLPVDPNGLPYVPDDIEFDTSNGIVYLLSNVNLNVFRWSLAERAYMQSIPLARTADYMAYSPVTDRLYLAYRSGEITQIDLAAPAPVETPFVNLPQSPLGLATAGQYVFSVDATGAWESHWTFAPDGTQISQEEWNYPSREFTWSPVNERIYHFRDGSSPNDLLWEIIEANGVIGQQMDSPYHSSAGIQPPIRVAPDGSVVILGSGRIYDAISLVNFDNLSNDVDDVAWVGSTVYTLRAVPGGSEIQEWGVNYGIDDSIPVAGTPTAMVNMEDRLLTITNVDGVPRFSVLDPALPRTDGDGDGILDAIDNCTLLANADQYDANHDGYGNLCDPDLDDDGSVTGADWLWYTLSRNRDVPVADFDGDGVVGSPTDNLVMLIYLIFQLPPGPSGLVP